MSELLLDDVSVNGAARGAPKEFLSPSATLGLAIIHKLADKARQWVTLTMSFALFAYVVAVNPDVKPLIGASLFTVLVHLPAWMKKTEAA